jgi:hypothetical protein
MRCSVSSENEKLSGDRAADILVCYVALNGGSILTTLKSQVTMRSRVNSHKAGSNPIHPALVYHMETMQAKGKAIHG